MKHLPILEAAKRAVRSMICTECYQRPHGSETLGAAVPRACEPRCTIFMHLPRIAAAVFEGKTTNQAGDQAMRNFVCPECHACPTAGDFCSDRLARTCPLSRYNAQVIAILEQVRDHHPAEAASHAALDPVRT